MNRWEEFNYIMDSNLSSNQKSLLLAIYRFINHETGLAYPSIETLMKTSGIKSKSTFLKIRKELVEQELIQYNQNGNKCLYQLTIKNEPIQKSDWYNNSSEVVQNYSHIGTKLDHKKKNYRKNEPINNINNCTIGTKLNHQQMVQYYNKNWMYELSTDLIN